MKARNLAISDLKSGLFISLIALPLCLGIAIASGFPPIAGVYTAIVGGLISSLIGSSPLTIKGPAAGLIVIAISAVQELGHGDLHLGYRRALAACAVAAIFQIGLALLKATRWGSVIPPSVVHGMLAAIGIIIFSKQVHIMLGVVPEGNTTLALLGEIPRSLFREDRLISFLGLFTLAGLFVFQKIKYLKEIPAILLNLMVVVPLGIFWHLGPKARVNLPLHAFASITLPDWTALLTRSGWKFAIMFALVGSIESILTVTAIDSLDPERRLSDLNKDLFSVGVGNLICALVGGLPMISEIVRSKANIDNKAKGISSNIVHGALILLAISFTPTWINEIPRSCLAAMLVVTGLRLASPSEFIETYKLGIDEALLFLTTLVVTILTDLLVGVCAGILMQMVIHLGRGISIKKLFTLVLERRKDEAGHLTLKPLSPCVFLNLSRLQLAIETELDGAEKMTLDLGSAGFVDHTCTEKFRSLSETAFKGRLQLEGLKLKRRGERRAQPEKRSAFN